MRIEGSTIIFKSDEWFYLKEKHGVKPNTVRVLNVDEYNKIMKTGLKKIRIVHKQNPEEYFEREITDISDISPIVGACGGKFIFIFSWKHEEGEEWMK